MRRLEENAPQPVGGANAIDATVAAFGNTTAGFFPKQVVSPRAKNEGVDARLSHLATYIASSS